MKVLDWMATFGYEWHRKCFRLARIKNEARRKREEREKAAELKKTEAIRRHAALDEQFLDWTSNTDGRVEMALVSNIL